MTNRYTTNPFLRLVDCYVLDAIGGLPTEQDSGLKQLEPRFRKLMHVAGGWREIVESKMEFTSDVREQIRHFWRGYQDAAIEQGVEANADEFVVHFVDQNFPFLLEP